MSVRSLKPPLIFLTFAVVCELLGISLCGGALNHLKGPSDGIVLLTGIFFFGSPFLILGALIWLGVRIAFNSAENPPPPKP